MHLEKTRTRAQTQQLQALQQSQPRTEGKNYRLIRRIRRNTKAWKPRRHETTQEGRMIPKMPIGMVAITAMSGAQAAPPRAAPDWSFDRFLIGKWSCEQTRPGHRIAHEEAVYTLGLGGRWLQLTHTLVSPESDPPVTTTTAYETFDSSLKKWVYISIGSDGDYR
jgi:hypothetical protein